LKVSFKVCFRHRPPDLDALRNVVARHAVATPPPAAAAGGAPATAGAALFFRHALAARSPDPNTGADVVGNLLLVTATADIAAGDELTTKFVDPDGDQAKNCALRWGICT